VFDTNIVIVGNVLTAPEWRRTTNTNSLVANFKVASTARRLDRESGRWIDGNSLRVRVNCWRRLAEGVASSIMVGDPIVVVGRLYTRDWTDADGNPRTMYEMEAVAVGHDLARGRGKFLRNRPTAATSTIEDEEAEAQVRGAAAEPVRDGEVPTRYGDGLFDDGDPDFPDVPPVAPARYDPVAAVRGGGFDQINTPSGTGAVPSPDDELAPFDGGSGHRPPAASAVSTPDGLDALDGLDAEDDDPEVDDPEDDDPEDGESSTGDEPTVDFGGPAAARRPRRNGRRVAVPA
jgi:single-strand DNA-binding protein